jgi:membrane associated rhomboid family serine protease
MTPTPVGMRCPECSKQRTQVRTAATMYGGEPRVTIAIIAICVILFLSSGGSIGLSQTNGGWMFTHLALAGPFIHLDHEYYRLVTSGFLHSGIFHIGFNMYLLWILGQQLERVFGSTRFATLYLTALLWGSFGALVQTTDSWIVGASGAVFGLMGALVVVQWRRGFEAFGGGLGGLIAINLVLSFVIPNVAFGGHIGGLIGGALAGLAIHEADRFRRPILGYVGCVALAAVAVAGAIVVSGDIHSLG